jgi:maltooligosyltrehalose trehalohydrolase
VDGLKRLVDAAHAQGLAVIQDVVYNHLGPAGNYLRDFSRDYFTHRHHTPWGDALNFDGPNSHGVREFFINNALYWAHEYHVDGLRLDATHAIIDDSPVHMLQELNQRLRDSLPAGRHFVIMAEDGRNEATLARPVDAGGYGLDGIWADDFHHAVRVTLTGEHEGYYREYEGGADEIVTTLRDGWFYQGQPTKRTGEPRGTPAGDLSPLAFVHCIQNHDQIGNRALGERLNHDVPSEAFRAASALLLLSPYMPLLFMGQEWAASTPFLFFTDHDPELGRLVTEGRRKEFKHFTAFSGEQVPDPQAVSTFENSKVNWAERSEQPHAGMWALYKDLIDLRKTQPACRNFAREGFRVQPLGAGALALRREPAAGGSPLLLVVNLRGSLHTQLPAELAGGRQWEIILDTEARSYSPNEGGSDSSRTATPFDGSHLMLDGPRALVLLGS